MECFILGSGGMMPMPRRRLASAAIRTGGAVYLFACGEGTQVPYKEQHLGQRPLRLVAITHLHADHCLGLPGMLMLRAQMPDPAPLVILGPPGLQRFIRHVQQDLAMYINYEIQVRQWQQGGPELAHEDELVRIFWRPLEHSVFCLGFRLEEHQRPGRFDPSAAEALSVPCGPLWGRLQAGQDVVIPGGGTVRPDQVLGPTRRGRHVAYITDTAPCSNISRLLHRTDLALVEGMFLSQHRQEAAEKKHLTVEQACTAAREAQAQDVRLIHFSPRYDARDLPDIDAEATQFHARARCARDGEVLEVPAPEE